ncbi:metallophosphoesterase family protein [Rhizobium herbae]|uniref:3',5'-cyclic AMP phosphodiesterase CpdA n=1 Tax=Rhizobium herbae TaxID=508661 RepID=A0ABS4ETY6_9HYPH|nr:metallophosphoesterase [Rhizobium herbae]MBP1861409.1 3',5'-cyclic AMP phosphodiesterase CpdA [Rhizobium herbae]
MPSSKHPRIAVIADAHFHDLYADYGFPGIVQGDRRLTFRLLADTARSTRVFNESYFAFHHALDEIAASGIRHVVLLGDYSDDGQVETVKGVKRVLDDYAARFGMRFYATVGNHDIFGAAGRHRAKRFMNEDGSYSILSSDPHMRDRGAHSVIASDRMYCRGYPDGLDAMADFGFFPRPGDLHWETPFGTDGNPAARFYQVQSPDGKTTRSLMDASYLVEPFPGVWLLMIDANVFVPVDGVSPGEAGDLADSTSAGWNAMLTHKRFVLDWMKDIAGRARHEGKCLLAFSHYPVLDPLDATVDDEVALLGRTGMSERIPTRAVAEALIAAGIDIHFSGHLHVNDTARHDNGDRFLINVAMPSLVAFPGAYKVVTVGEQRIDIETVGINAMPLDADLRLAYDKEIVPSRLEAGSLLDVDDYGGFLFEHLAHLVGRRYLKREWPKDITAMIRTLDLDDLAALALIDEPVAAVDAIATLAAARTDAELQQRLAAAGAGAAQLSVTAMEFLADWYRLRMGSELAFDWITRERMASYRAVGQLFADGNWSDTNATQARFALIFRMFWKYASGLPSGNFSIDRMTGAISRIDLRQGEKKTAQQ